MNKIVYTFFLGSVLFVSGCGISGEIISYPALCSSGLSSGDCGNADAGNKEVFRLEADGKTVVSNMPDTNYPIEKYSDCAILNLENWTCQFNDKSGEFGFKNGKYFKQPLLTDGLRYVNKEEWESAKLNHKISH